MGIEVGLEEDFSTTYYDSNKDNIEPDSDLIISNDGKEYRIVHTKVDPFLWGYERYYFIMDGNNKSFANFRVQNLGDNDIYIEYENNNLSFNGKGLMTKGLGQVVEDVFKEGVFDGLVGKRGPIFINSIKLSINSNNIASQRIAIGNGFAYDRTTESASLTRSEYNREIKIV